MRKLATLVGLWFGLIFGSIGCFNERIRNNVQLAPVSLQRVVKQELSRKQNRISYELSNLYNTEIQDRNLTLHVYIVKSEKLWDYHENKEELFGYIKSFFKDQKINCYIIYSLSDFSSFNSPNEVGVEILDSDESLEKRCVELSDTKIRKNTGFKGHAVTNRGIALINGGWEEFRDYMTRKEVEEQFNEIYEGVTKKEFTLRLNAGNICHEVLHCFGLFHPSIFNPDVIQEFENGIPNIMSYYTPKFSDKFPVGYTLDLLQRKMMHSFIAGNMMHGAFVDSGRDLDLFTRRIAEANNLKILGN